MMKKMAIITSYFDGESYGLLGPQMAATVIQENTPYECIVIAVTHSDDKTVLKKALSGYFGREMPIVGFSSLSGREDLFLFAKALKAEGAVTILAGPQSDVDFSGETGWRDYPHRFRGLSECFSFALQGPAEQAIPVLEGIANGQWRNASGLLYTDDEGRIVKTPRQSWKNKFLRRVRWNNLYRVGRAGLENPTINSGQVLQHIGCPHAARAKLIEVDYPYHLDKKGDKKIRLKFRGCSFCDVSSDKGFYGALNSETVLSQIACLPEDSDGRKISFELINENALPGLPLLIRESSERGMSLTQINLTLRADWFLSNENYLREALHMARKLRMRIMLSSIGFESFDDRILRNLNKGLTVKTNIDAILLMRRLKNEFPLQWAYSNRDGANHGFIHPTPWDSPETDFNIQQVTASCRMHSDILPAHSVPLIIHHASGLADWIREIETSEKMLFERYVSVIGWWREALLGRY
ncbi:MAG: hypothetical protein KKF00_06440 [Proteobacteria bacterium]|nr:hypothetical protein [Pseudomonadota bacterium]